jgi:hypothetical protein
LWNHADNPHNQEEHHHRRYEVGIGDFPLSAVVFFSTLGGLPYELYFG